MPAAQSKLISSNSYKLYVQWVRRAEDCVDQYRAIQNLSMIQGSSKDTVVKGLL